MNLKVMSILLGIAFGLLAYRLVDLQILRHGRLKVIAQQNTQRQYLYEPRRGDILDVRGNLLATSAAGKVVCADPTLIGPRAPEVARALAPLLQTDEAELSRRLTPHVFRNDKGGIVTNSFVRLKSRVTVESWEKIQAAMTGLTFAADEKTFSKSEQAFLRALRKKAVFAQEYPIRTYPNQTLAAHVIGFAATTERKIDEHVINQIQGRDGIEFMLDSKLSGVPGWRLTETDGRGREIVPLREQDVEPREGLNVVLTIDAFVQSILESVLAETMEKHSPISVSGIVVRPRTGEILALATLPAFNPNDPAASPLDARRNRAISDVVEPGSTFKIVVGTAALSDGLTTLEERFDCERGRFAYGGRVLHDHEAYGLLSVKEIMMKSSNIGAAKLGLRLGEQRLHQYLGIFGFGERTGIPLPGEVRGIVNPVKRWSKVSIAQIPMGHGVAVTRIQMAMAMSALANRGLLMRPMLVNRLEDQQGNVVVRYSPQSARQVVTERAALDMVEALKTVVSPEGTAPKAAMEHYTVAGKTGTAQKVENGAYVRGKYISSFIGFLPADNPELCISIVLDEPREGYYGGSVAGPAFKQVAERAAAYLNIRPDIKDGPAAPEALAQTETPRVVVTR